MELAEEKKAELNSLFDSRQFKRLKEELCDMNEVDVAELLGLDLSLNTATKEVMTLPELNLPKDAVILEDDFDSFGDMGLDLTME